MAEGRVVNLGLVQMRMQRDEGKNLQKAVRLVAEAAEKGADIVCLPELFTSLYFPATRNARTSPQKIPGAATSKLAEAARANGVILVGGSIYEKADGKRYNTCVVFDGQGRVRSKYRKVHIPQDDHYFEQDYFSPGKYYAVASTQLAQVGTLICFDQWYPEPARVEALMGAEILFYPTAIGRVRGIEEAEGDWQRAWESVQVGHAIANSVVVCSVNRVGTEGETRFWGGSFVCDQFGKVLFRAGDAEGVFVVKCDLGLSRIVEQGWGFRKLRKAGTYGKILR